eukprot:4808138-Prymnesium_polylepis.1
MHRIAVGHFTQTSRVEIIGLPVVSKGNDWFSGMPALLYTINASGDARDPWSEYVIVDNYFHFLHEFTMGKFLSADGSELDSIVASSIEGVTWMWFDTSQPGYPGTSPDHKLGRWQLSPIGLGEQ